MKVKIKKNGLTLLELLVAIAIIVIMASMVFVATSGGWIDANTKQTQGTISLIQSAIEDYREFNGYFPEPNELFIKYGVTFPDDPLGVTNHSASLYLLLNSIPDSRKALEKLTDNQVSTVSSTGGQIYFVFIDAWKQTIDYKFYAGINTYPVIISAGPDKIFNTFDDITNRK